MTRKHVVYVPLNQVKIFQSKYKMYMKFHQKNYCVTKWSPLSHFISQHYVIQIQAEYIIIACSHICTFNELSKNVSVLN